MGSLLLKQVLKFNYIHTAVQVEKSTSCDSICDHYSQECKKECEVHCKGKPCSGTCTGGMKSIKTIHHGVKAGDPGISFLRCVCETSVIAKSFDSIKMSGIRDCQCNPKTDCKIIPTKPSLLPITIPRAPLAPSGIAD